VEGTNQGFTVPVEQTVPFQLLSPLLAGATRKGFLSSEHYLKYAEFLTVKLRAFEMGVVLGVAFRTRLRVLVRMLVWQDGFDSIADGIVADGAALIELASFVSRDNEASSLVDLFLGLEFEARGHSTADLLRWKNKKVELSLAMELSCVGFLGGLGLGAARPALAEELWRNTWERPTEGLWPAAQRAGIALEAPRESMSFEARQAELVAQVRQIAVRYYGDLLGYLGTPVREVAGEVNGADGARQRITLRGIEGWAFTDDDELLCPGCIESKLKDERFSCKDGTARDASGVPVSMAETDLDLQMTPDDLEYLEPLSRAWPRREYAVPYRPDPTPERPWKCDGCGRSIPMTIEAVPG